MKEQITCKRGIQRQISSWRRQLSVHSESGLAAENMELNLQVGENLSDIQSNKCQRTTAAAGKSKGKI